MNGEEKIKRIYAKNRKEWRRWLRKNHKKESKGSLIKYKKHTGKPSLTSKEAMEEAICFGWIDTTVNRLDEERYMQRFSKRSKNSRWSKNTLRYAKNLLEQGKMSKAGIEAYEKGLKRKPFDHKRSKNPKTPQDLIKELDKSRKAMENFEKMAKSYRRFYIWWIEDAKRIETRKKRIKEVVKRVKEGKKFGE
jgi:uncharacterized protein YdeI (YjbR/CyaY-like superfamily)